MWPRAIAKFIICRNASSAEFAPAGVAALYASNQLATPLRSAERLRSEIRQELPVQHRVCADSRRRFVTIVNRMLPRARDKFPERQRRPARLLVVPMTETLPPRLRDALERDPPESDLEVPLPRHSSGSPTASPARPDPLPPCLTPCIRRRRDEAGRSRIRQVSTFSPRINPSPRPAQRRPPPPVPPQVRVFEGRSRVSRQPFYGQDGFATREGDAARYSAATTFPWASRLRPVSLARFSTDSAQSTRPASVPPRMAIR